VNWTSAAPHIFDAFLTKSGCWRDITTAASVTGHAQIRFRCLPGGMGAASDSLLAILPFEAKRFSHYAPWRMTVQRPRDITA